jgi:hypothetical protein
MKTSRRLALAVLPVFLFVVFCSCTKHEQPRQKTEVRKLSEQPVRGRIRAVRKFRKDWLKNKTSDKKLKEKYGLSESELREVKRAVRKRTSPTLPDLLEKKDPPPATQPDHTTGQ